MLGCTATVDAVADRAAIDSTGPDRTGLDWTQRLTHTPLLRWRAWYREARGRAAAAAAAAALLEEL